MNGVTIGDAVGEAARTHGNRIAYVIGDAAITYAELAERSWRLAHALHRAGVRRGDRVGVLSRPSIAYLVVTFAAARVGAAAVPFNSRLKSGDWDRAVHLARPHLLLVGPPGQPGSLDDSRPQTEDIEEFYQRGITGADPGSGGFPPGEGADIAQIQFTSGSTGSPKLVQLRQDAILRAGRIFAAASRTGPGDRFFSPLPFHHAGGSVLATMSGLVAGCPVYVQPVFDPAAAMALMAEERATLTIGHQPHYAEYLARAARTPTSLRAAYSIADPVFNARVQEFLGPGRVISPYGLTETTLGGTAPSVDDPEPVRVGTVGRPEEGVDVRIVDPAGGPAELGEVLIRGWCVSPGYLGDDAPRLSDPDGWFHTGDLGCMDADGNLRLRGRIKDIVRVGGENVAPLEVENFVMTHPRVKQAAVLGKPDERLGEICVAAVELHEGSRTSHAELVAYCAEGLASFKVPRRIVTVTDWPRTASGKLDKRALRPLFEPSPEEP